MTEVYSILEEIKESISENGITNTVTHGNITDIDLDKTTMFPLAHIVMREVDFEEHTINFSLRIMCLDIIDYEKTKTDEDLFYGNNNLQDVLNTQLQVANLVVSSLRRGVLHNSLYQLDGSPKATILREVFENELAGWGLEVNIQVPNNKISICS